MNHLYDFTATFEDGSEIHLDRNGSDISTQFENKTLFTDVLEKDKTTKLVSFVIHNDEQSLGVDLRDGHFEINGVPFWQHRPDLVQYEDFRIIYYRTVRKTIAQNGEILSGEILGYTVGWQVTHEGENIQKTVLI